MKSYEEGVNDGIKLAEKNCISVDAVNDSIDKFLDKINNQKNLLQEIKVFLEEDFKNKELKEELINKINSQLNNEVDKNGKKVRKQEQI